MSESQAGFRFGRSCVDNIFISMKLYKVDFKKVRKHFVFSLILRKHMIPSGETDYGTECGK